MFSKTLKEDAPWIKLAKQKDSDGIKYLYDKYEPVHMKIFYDYRNAQIEREDWLQEALINCYHTACQYDLTKRVTFGAFYRKNLKCRMIDLIRRKNAYKRKSEIDMYYYQHDYHDFQSESQLCQHQIEELLMYANSMPDYLKLLSHSEKQTFLTLGKKGEYATRLGIVGSQQLKAEEQRCKKKFKQYFNYEI